MKRTKQLLAIAILAVAVWTAWSPSAEGDGFSGFVWYSKCITTENVPCNTDCITWIGYSDSNGNFAQDTSSGAPTACFVGYGVTSSLITTNICLQDTSVYHYYCIQDGNTAGNPCGDLYAVQCSDWYADGERCNTEENPTSCPCTGVGGALVAPELLNFPVCTGSGILP